MGDEMVVGTVRDVMEMGATIAHLRGDMETLERALVDRDLALRRHRVAMIVAGLAGSPSYDDSSISEIVDDALLLDDRIVAATEVQG